MPNLTFIPDVQSSSTVRKDYNKFSKHCHETGLPVVVTKNGEADLIVMSPDAYNQIIAGIQLNAKLTPVEVEIAKGAEKLNDAYNVLNQIKERIENV